MATHSSTIVLPGKSHGQRSLVGYSPRGRKESDWAQNSFLTLCCFCVGILPVLLEPKLGLGGFFLQPCVSSAYLVGCCYHGTQVLSFVTHSLLESRFLLNFLKYTLLYSDFWAIFSLPSVPSAHVQMSLSAPQGTCLQFGVLTLWRVDLYFSVGFWDRPLQYQHSLILLTSASWLPWGLPVWLCWSQLLLAACTHNLKFIGFLYLLFLSETRACDFFVLFCSFSFHYLVAVFPRQAERFRIELLPCSSRIIINIIIFVTVKI